MSFANTPAARRRRRFAPVVAIESLEARELMTAAGSVSAFPASAADLHAQYLRLEQLHRIEAPTTAKVVAASVHAARSHAAASHSASTTATHQTLVQRATKSHLVSDMVVLTPAATVDDGNTDLASYSPVNGAKTPAQLRTAYGVSSLGLSNQGQGTTIAIIDEFDDPNIASDASVYSSQYNLPQLDGLNGDPLLTVYKDQALGTVTSSVGTGVAGETDLDVEVAHAMAPMANILLVEVPATGNNANAFAQLLHGVQYAAGQPGVDVVSLSYGGTERSIGAANVLALDSTYLASAPVNTVPLTVSTGDSSTPSYPATSPNAIAVGGTSLYLASLRGKYSYETAWGGQAGAGAGGGGLSTNFATPTYQASNGVLNAKRSIPDVSLIGDPYTGISYYDSLDVTSQYPDPWGQVGGTSVAAPVFAGMLDLAQQDRIAAGSAILSSTQINTAIYNLYNSPSYLTYFHDINQGTNANVTSSGRTTVAGTTATTGYDLATGVGSPIGSTFVPYLASL